MRDVIMRRKLERSNIPLSSRNFLISAVVGLKGEAYYDARVFVQNVVYQVGKLA